MKVSKKWLIPLVLIVVLVPVAFFGILYYQMTSLQIGIDFDVTQAIDWIMALWNKKLPDVKITLTMTNPTFLPIDLEDIYIQLFIEDQYVFDTTIENLFVPAGKTVNKDLTFTVTEAGQTYLLIDQAMNTYGGEVKVGIGGHAVAHQLLLSLRIPFFVEKYIMAREGALHFVSAEWTALDGQTISTTTVGTEVCVQVIMENPTRKHTVSSVIGTEIRRDVSLWFDETMSYLSTQMTLPQNTSDTISFHFTPPRTSRYHFDIFIDGEKTYTQPNTVPPRLEVTS